MLNYRFNLPSIPASLSPPLPISAAPSVPMMPSLPDLSRVRRWSVDVLRPPGYKHSGAMWEAAEGMRYALLSLGYEVAPMGSFDTSSDALLVFGSHLFPPEQELPPHAVLFNLEQIVDEEWRKHPTHAAYIRRLYKHRVWDYHRSNVEWLADRGHAAVSHVPIGFVPELERIPPAEEEDIDVLFYGSMNPRRAKVLDELHARGLRVVHLFGVYGKARDAAIARAKVVLNHHFVGAQLFEIVRLSYLLANGKAVVCEHSVMGAEDEFLRDGMAYVPYEDLVETCAALVADPVRRRALAQRGQALFKQRSQVDALARALGQPAGGATAVQR